MPPAARLSDLSTHGGWEILRDYLRQGRHRDAFQFRDYLY